MARVLTGRVWKFGDHINTDLIQPSRALLLPMAEQTRYMFEAYRPGWVDQVQPGDVLLAGVNFGAGSGRPAAQLLKRLGIAALVADSINGLFLRNCINYGLPALQCPGVSAGFAELDTVQIDLDGWSLRNLRTGQTFPAKPLPALLRQMMLGGGIIADLAARGYIRRPQP